MSLHEIPSGSVCVIDSNILIYAEQGVSAEAQRLLLRIAEMDLSGVLPQPVWQETMHRLMVLEAITKGHVRGNNPAKQLASKPQVIQGLVMYREKIKALRTIGLRFEPCNEDDLFEEAIKIQKRYGLLTNDSLIAAMVLRLEADALVTTDTRLQQIEEITVYAPSDLTLRAPKSS